MAAYYNEFDPYAAEWLRNLIAKNLIAPGDVDQRSITEVRADDLRGYTQCHFFAGIGGWSYAARLAGWPDDRELWSGSCPCQPFSLAGKGEGQSDERHLWPVFFDLIAARRPSVVMGEQVAAAVGKDWLDGVFVDLESIGYACGATVVPACAVDAPHRRDRLWFVADAYQERRDIGSEAARSKTRLDAGANRGSHVDNAERARLEGQCRDGDHGDKPGWFDPLAVGSASPTGGALSDADRFGRYARGGHETAGLQLSKLDNADNSRNSTAWSGSEWAVGADGKARRVKPGIRLLANGVPARVGKLRAYGNAIVPQVAAEVIAAYLETTRPVINHEPNP